MNPSCLAKTLLGIAVLALQAAGGSATAVMDPAAPQAVPIPISSPPKDDPGPTPGGVWQEMPPPLRYWACGAYDAVNDRLVLLAGQNAVYRGEVWSFSFGPGGAWMQLHPQGETPGLRYSASAVYDPVGKRVIVFGGYGPSGFSNDVWALMLSGEPAWVRLSPQGDPPAGRMYHSAVYDSGKRRMIVFGGIAGFGDPEHELNDTWSLTLSETPTWSRIVTPDSLPPSRYAHVAVYDEARHAMVVFGGRTWRRAQERPAYALDDVWELNLANSPRWNQVTTSGTTPPTTAWIPGVYDAGGGRLIVITPRPTRTWSLALEGDHAWKELFTEGNASPFPRGPAIYDPLRRRMVSYALGKVWALTLDESPSWSELAEPNSTPLPRWFHSSVYDSLRQQMIVFGGGQRDSLRFVSDEVWALALRGYPRWTLLAPQGQGPRGQGQTAIFDPVKNRVLIFGPCAGFTMGSNPTRCSSDLWSLSVDSVPRWTPIAASGPFPEATNSKAASYDPGRRRMIVLTNPLGGPPAIHAISLDSDPVWNSLPLTGEVPLVLGYSIVSLYDSEADRMVVLDEWTGRLWSVSLGMSPLEWAQLPNPPGGPTLVHAAFLDPLRRRIVAFGQTSGLPRLPMQTWFYDLDSALGWTPSPFSGAPPYGREGNSVIYDPVFDRAVLFGGFIPGFDWGMIDAVFSDTWSFFLGAPTQEVAIDVKPGDRANLIPIRSKGVMEVAILGSSSFNPDSIVASSVTLAGASIRSRGNADPTILWRDVNRDGFIDLVLGVEADEVRLGPADTLAVLRGMTTGGGRIVGFDRVRPVPGTRREAPNVAQAQFGLSLRPSERFRPGEVLAFHYSLPMPISARMELMDIMGRRLALRELPGASQVGELELTETRHLPAGLYFVRLSQARQQVTLRVVIMR